MKHIVVSGYYGCGNTGDEAVLGGMLASFRALGADVDFTVLSRDPAGTTSVHGVAAVSRNSLGEVARSIKSADLLISGGGSLLQDVTSARSAAYYLGVMFVGLAFGKPVMAYAQGVGPLLRPTTTYFSRLLLDRARLITVRDEDSAELLRRIGVARPPVHVTADPSFDMDPASEEAALSALCRAGAPDDRPLLGVAVRNWKAGDEWPSVLAEGIRKASERLAATPLFLPMHYPEDVTFAAAIASEVGAQAVVLQSPLLPGLAKAIVGRVDVMLAMRLHALMFAAAVGAPAVALSYDPKVTSFAGNLPGGLPVLSTSGAGPSDIADAVEQAWERRADIRRELEAKLPDWRQEARKNASLALELLEL